ncbi:MAG: patatin-like phospholipase family protein [Clostridia bacterium]|nr:patatin-like phospholipase family protein [Clostridia bacterium]MDD4375894.1 patatin-like phospholipase family protein [Clostridia bacterium]
MSLGIALSGGGAKGAAHIGVLEALKDHGIKIDYISGTSSGSIIAAFYAAGYSSNEILRLLVSNTKNNKLLDYDKTMVFKLMKLLISRKLTIDGFIKGDKIENLIRRYMKEKNIFNISDIKMPLAIPIVNLKTGEIVYYSNKEVTNKEEKLLINDKEAEESEYITKDSYEKAKVYDDYPEYRNAGDIADIIRASISFPGVFKPKNIEGNIYIDGGVRVNTPVKILKEMGAKKVIAISFDCNRLDNKNLKNIIGITNQAIDILIHEADEDEQKLADINIRICTKGVSLLDFNKSIQLTRKGYYVINNNIKYIKDKIGIN